MNHKRIAVAAAALGFGASLAGCLSPQHSLNPDWGVANRSFIAAQTADPDARYAREQLPASSGPRAADASDRYVRGEVIPPAAESTSSVAGGGGAPSGGSSR